MNKKYGAVPSQMIREMIKGGFIKNAIEENINPASYDLTISDEIYRVDGIFQPRQGEVMENLLGLMNAVPHALSNSLDKGVNYLAKLNESFHLPEGVYGYCNPKSTTGRNDIHVRILADGVLRYDALPHSYRGNLWVSIIPKSFPVKLYKGVALSQLRLFNEDTRFNELDLQIYFKKDRLLWNTSEQRPFEYEEIKTRDNDGSLILTLDLASDIVGYECMGTDKVLDFSKIKGHKADDFFKPLKKMDYIHLRKNAFYILSTREAVSIPPHLTCEMVPMDERSGEFRSHYAGFIDPGWGWGKEGEGQGRPLTLEVRPFEDIIIRDNQPIGKIRFEKVMEIPDILYDEIASSNYTTQKVAKLSKHFYI